MKTMLMTRLAITLLGLTLGLAGAGLARGDEQVSTSATSSESQTSKAEESSRYKGSIVAADPQEKTVTVSGVLTTRTFNIGDNCQIALEDKPRASLADLAVGQKVEVKYRKVQGISVAQEVTQENRAFRGHITALDPGKRTIAVKRGRFSRSFALANGSTVIVKNDKAGTLESLRIGDVVTVIYQSDNNPLIAQRVEQNNPTFTGTIRAIDARTRTVAVRSILGEKKFHLARGCKIVVNGNPNAGLHDLRIGDPLSVSYEDVDGVLVANRIGLELAGHDESDGRTASSAFNRSLP